MQRLKFFMIGFGFFWMFLWAVIGSLLGAKLNHIYATGSNVSWLHSVEKSLIKTAHAHMNSMAMTTILMGLCLPPLAGYIPTKWIKFTIISHLLSLPLFGFGLLLEAFYPTQIGQLSILLFVKSMGAILFMISLALWSGFFFSNLVLKKDETK